MKKLALLIFILSISTNSFCQNTRKVLFIGVDGCRWDALVAANTPAIDNLLSTAKYSGNGLTEYKTWSGTGWSNMLTGVWHTKHGTTDNTFSGSNYVQYPDFISRAEGFDAGLSTISVVHWSPLNTTIIQNIDSEITLATDLAVKDSAVSVLTNQDPDLLFVAFDDVDHTGHSYGFSTQVPEYIDAIEITDAYIGEITSALQNRPTYNEEDWLVVVTTDHGGTMAGHGGGTLEERTIFTIYSNPAFTSEIVSRNEISNPETYNEGHFIAGTYAIPQNQTPFSFGTSQDFTIELWVKASSYTGDPSFISNKDWNSGLNEGFVLCAQQGQFWKVNIGDGTNRLDIQGGYIEPDQWHHLAVSCDRDGLMTVYEDGAVVGFEWMQSIGNINSGYPLVINQDGTTGYGLDFDGSYKDIRIWNAALPDSVIVDWASTPVTNSHPFYNSLLANWKCVDGTDIILEDASPNANNCEATGFIDWNADQTSTFTVYDYSNTPREPDNAVTALDWLCIPIQEDWNLDGTSWVTSCIETAIYDHDATPEFTLQPNPVSEYVSISWAIAAGDNTSLLLQDASGKLLSKIPIQRGDTFYQLSLKDYPAGIYFITLEDGLRRRSAKFIRE